MTHAEKEIIDLFNKGYGYKYISKTLELSEWTVRKFLESNNLKHKNNEQKKIIENYCLSLIYEGYTQEEIVKECGYSNKNVLLAICKRNNIDYPITEKQKLDKERDLKIIEDRKNNMSMSEISKKYNLTINNVGAICRKYDFGGKRSQNKGYNKYQTEKGPIKRIQEVKEVVENEWPEFEFVDYIIGANDSSRIILKCKVCGNILNRSVVAFRHKQIRCDVCYESKRNLIKKQQLKEKEELKLIKEKQKEKENRIKHITEYLSHESKKQYKICPVCGNTFTTYKSNVICCSDKCSRKRQNRRKDNRFKGQHRDYGITPKALYDKYNGTCWICGGQCDLNDFVINKDKNGNDVIVCGGNYPSVDHIQPSYKNGPDVWENVKLAHRKCNWERYIKEIKAED